MPCPFITLCPCIYCLEYYFITHFNFLPFQTSVLSRFSSDVPVRAFLLVLISATNYHTPSWGGQKNKIRLSARPPGGSREIWFLPLPASAGSRCFLPCAWVTRTLASFSYLCVVFASMSYKSLHLGPISVIQVFSSQHP